MTNYVRAMGYLLSLMQHSSWDSEKLRSYQNSQLRKIARYAYEKSPFYHKLFMQARVKPEDITETKDLAKLPILKKTEIVNKADRMISIDFRKEELKAYRTSGSTGQPLHIYLTQAEDEFRKVKHLRAQMALGQKPWDKWMTITSPLHFAETTKVQKMLHFFSTTPISVFDDISAQIGKITSVKPNILDGYSNSIYLLAKEMKKGGVDPVKLKFLVGGSELIASHSRKFVEDFFGAPFYDQYAAVEFERIAWQCREKREYHIDSDSVVVEFVDENGEQVANGETGEIVCTSLFNYAMPIIRYSLDDVGASSEEITCNCGRSFPLMKLFEGRKNSFITLPNGRVLAPIAFMLAVWTFKYFDQIDIFRVIQKKKDLLVFRLKLDKRSLDARTIESELQNHVRANLNLPSEEVKIEVEVDQNLSVDKSGKFNIVSSQC